MVGAGAGGERDEKRQRGDRGGRVDREAQGAGSFCTSWRHRGQYTLGGGRIEEGANGECLRMRLSMRRKNWERRFVGAWGIEGEILRCAQNDGVTATATANGPAKAGRYRWWGRLRGALVWLRNIGVVKTRGEGWGNCVGWRHEMLFVCGGAAAAGDVLPAMWDGGG